MQEITTNISWVSVIVGTVLAFILGALWYSPSMFGKKWREGIGTAELKRPLAPLLAIQAGASFLYAWALVAAASHSLSLAILIALAATALVKANDLFSGKNMYVVWTEAGYVLAQAVVILLVLRLIG